MSCVVWLKITVLLVLQPWIFRSALSPLQLSLSLEASFLDAERFGFQDKESVGELVKLIDKSNGYIFAGIDASVVEYSKISVRQTDWEYNRYPFSY